MHSLLHTFTSLSNERYLAQDPIKNFFFVRASNSKTQKYRGERERERKNGANPLQQNPTQKTIIRLRQTSSRSVKSNLPKYSRRIFEAALVEDRLEKRLCLTKVGAKLHSPATFAPTFTNPPPLLFHIHAESTPLHVETWRGVIHARCHQPSIPPHRNIEQLLDSLNL